MEQNPQPILQLASFFDTFSESSLEKLNTVYHPDVQFNDPINAAKGIEQLHRVYKDLFTQLRDIEIKVRDQAGNSDLGFLRWTMDYRFRRHDRTIEGATHARFDEGGLVKAQTDFWDASFPIYGEFPLISLAMKGIRRMIKVRHPEDSGL